jgi:hypothetical protein
MGRVSTYALGELGTYEDPPNSNKVKYNTWMYGREVQGAAYPWCGAFVSFCFSQAGFPLGKIDMMKGFIGCQYAVSNVLKWGHIVTVPKEEDVVMYDWNGDGHFDHTGIFIKDLGKGLFQAVEGNTSFGNNSNGGKVMLRSDRKYKNAIFIRPNVLLSEAFAGNKDNIDRKNAG